MRAEPLLFPAGEREEAIEVYIYVGRWESKLSKGERD